MQGQPAGVQHERVWKSESDVCKLENAVCQSHEDLVGVDDWEAFMMDLPVRGKQPVAWEKSLLVEVDLLTQTDPSIASQE